MCEILLHLQSYFALAIVEGALTGRSFHILRQERDHLIIGLHHQESAIYGATSMLYGAMLGVYLRDRIGN